MSDFVGADRDWLGEGPPRKRAKPQPGEVSKRIIPHPRVRCPDCGAYMRRADRTRTDWPWRHYRCPECALAFITRDDGPR